MTDNQRERLKSLANEIKKFEERIVELETSLKSDVITMRTRLNLQQTLKTNIEILKLLKLEFWVDVEENFEENQIET